MTGVTFEQHDNCFIPSYRPVYSSLTWISPDTGREYEIELKHIEWYIDSLNRGDHPMSDFMRIVAALVAAGF